MAQRQGKQSRFESLSETNTYDAIARSILNGISRIAAIRTGRLTLRSWQSADREDFARLNADPEVMRDLGGPFDRTKSDAKFDRYVAAFEEHGFTRWLLEDFEGRFVGHSGVMPSAPDQPLGHHVEIG